MILIIGTTDKICSVGLYDKGKNDSIKWSWKKDTGTEVLDNINRLLKKHQKKLADLKAIMVNRGPGSYTGTRVGITVANGLGWARKIPVIGYNKDSDPKELIDENYQEIIKSPKNHFPTPRYLF